MQTARAQPVPPARFAGRAGPVQIAIFDFSIGLMKARDDTLIAASHALEERIGYLRGTDGLSVELGRLIRGAAVRGTQPRSGVSMTLRRSLHILSLMICVCCALASAAHAASLDSRAGTHAHARLVSSENNEQAIHNEELAVARDLKTRVEQGDAAAMNGLGMMYALGRGVSRNYGTALDLFRRSALQGQVPGMVNVGLLYDRHANQPGHSISAYAWLRAALSFGVPDEDRDAVIFRLGMIASRIGEANAARAERLASLLVEDIGQRVGAPESRSADSASN